MNLKTAIIFFGLGIVQGMILMDWVRDKRDLRAILRGPESVLDDEVVSSTAKDSKASTKALRGSKA